MSGQSNVLAFEDSRRAYYARRGAAAPSVDREERRSARNDAPRPAVEAYEPEGSAAEGVFAALRSKVSKNKADRQFEKQFGGSAPDAGAGPRAAVYKGEMGTSHRRAARMQDSPTQRPSMEVRTPKVRQKQSLTHKPWFIAVATALACILFAGVFLYPTAREYYVSIRENDRLQAEYAAVLERNTELSNQMANLATNEGMAAYAHDRYGLVMPEDNAVVFQGLIDQTKNGMENVAANVIPGSIKAPETWYSPVLDVFFGYK